MKHYLIIGHAAFYEEEWRHMKFDDELGRYIEEIEAEGKANGGIMRLNGGGRAGLARGAWDWLKSILKKKPKDRTPDETDAVARAQEQAADAARSKAQEGAPFRIPEPRSSGSRASTKGADGTSGGGKPKPGKKEDSDSTPVGGGGANKDGMIKKGLKSTGKLALYGTGAYGVYKLLADNADNAEEKLNTAIASGASDTEIAALKAELAGVKEKLAEALKGNTTGDESSDEGNPLKRLFSKARQSLTFDDPEKALYIAGQMMKPTEGIVPVNAFTAGTEAAMAYDKSQSEMARDQAAIDQVGTDLEREFFTLKSSAEAELGRELKPTEANELLLHVRTDMQSKKALMTLFSTTAPDLINKDTVNQLSLSEAANYIRELKA